MRHHRIEQRIVAQRRVVEPEVVIGRALAAQHVAHGNAHAPDQIGEGRAIGRRLEVFDDDRLLATVADQRERVA